MFEISRANWPKVSCGKRFSAGNAQQFAIVRNRVGATCQFSNKRLLIGERDFALRAECAKSL
jgi:hypothetical protein